MHQLISNYDIRVLILTLICAFILWILSKHYYVYDDRFLNISKTSKKENTTKDTSSEILIDELNKLSKEKTIDVNKIDDFIAIEGIGPKINELLHNANIHNFETLSYTTVEELQRILDQGGHHFKMANPKTWPEQARLASEGDWERLRDYQDMLYSGV